MTYQATVCYLSNVKPLEGSDNLSTAFALGYCVVTGRNAREDVLGVCFPEGGRLSHEMLMANNLYRKNPATGEPMGGYFEPNGRIKAIKLRGAKSEAFWTPLISLAWTGYDLNTLVEGDTFTELNCALVCKKYYTSATLREMARNQRDQKVTRRSMWQRVLNWLGKPVAHSRIDEYAPEFSRHFDTGQFREVVHFLTGQKTSLLVTEKLHGTSGRTGNVVWTKRTWKQNIWAKVGLYHDPYRVVSGSRKVVYNPDLMGMDDGYYEGSTFRSEIHNYLMEKGLHTGEILYYEIVGYSQGNKLIMPEHSLSKAEAKEAGIPEKELAAYGDTIKYTYGCNPGEYKVYLYRITQDGHDMSYDYVMKRAVQLGVGFVPMLGVIEIDESDTVGDILAKVEPFTRGNSTIDNRHIKEGVCLRVFEVGVKKARIWKYKGFLFCLLEGIKKNSDTYVDLEEIS